MSTQAPVVHADGGGGKGKTPTVQEGRESAWKAIEEFAKQGKGKASDLPKLVQRLNHSEGVKKLMPEIAKRAPGDIVIELADAVNLELVEGVRLAVNARPPATRAVLQRYLHPRGNNEVKDLGDDADLVKKLRAVMPGPMGVALPQLASLPSMIHDNLPLMTWYVETTAPMIAAVQYAGAAQSKSKPLAATLDTLDAWGWVDHVQIAASDVFGRNLTELANNTKNEAAKTKLATLAAKYTMDAVKRNDELRAAHQELPKQIEKKDDAALLDAAARTLSQENNVDDKKLLSRLRGESAEMVFQYVIAARHDIETVAEAFANAKGDSAPYLREYLRREESSGTVKALTNDAARKHIRKVLGRSTSLLELLEGLTIDTVHAKIAADEALRRWIYEDPDERATLWLAAAEAQGAKRNCRLVASEHGNGWVKRLTGSADTGHLRRFVLNSNDAGATKFIKDNLLRDAPHSVDAAESEVVAIDGATYGAGTKARLSIETAGSSADADTVLARISDLSPKERAEVVADPSAMKRMLDDVYGPSLVRAMYLLTPTLTQLLAMPFTGPQPGLLSYVASRPDREEVAAAQSPRLVKAARALFGFNSPVDVFPSLKQPANLAAALVNNDALLEWLLEETEPSYALSLLSRDPVRPIATGLMENRATVYSNLPAYDLLLPEGQKGYDALHKGIKDDDSREQSTAYKDGEPDLDIDLATNKRAENLDDATDMKDLAKAVLELQPTNDKAGMLALVRRAPAAQQIKLLDGKHREATNALRSVTKLMPHQIFDGLPIAQLFALDGAARWMLTWETPTVLLSLLAQDRTAVKPLGKRLDAEADQITWIESLPRGAGLMANERQVLDDLCQAVSTAPVLRALFRARFDVEVKGFDYAETKKLWRIVQRLPPSQLNQNVVAKMVETDIGKPLGQWGKPDIEIDDSSERFEKDDSGYDEGQQLTRDQVKKQYGLNDAELATASKKDGWLVEKAGKYSVKPVPIKQFESTVLHEIGHSVDTLLGDQTELIYGLAGWKTYGVDQFESWAGDMQGLDKISAADKPKVVEVWKHSIRGNTSVKNLADVDHPALDAKYQGNPLVDTARAGKRFYYGEADKKVHAGRVCMTRDSMLYSLNEQGYNAAPSQYSLYAPAEYFAECYVEYYRQYDGTPKTEGDKGGRLAPWIKEWFAKYVDKIRLSPARVRKTDDGES
ncbi:MAG: hypothetical protein H0T89_24800 [Deltaproteobacteria bacterium]|nr:hypothetical protein [Deltaproteobacteria bacterium]MDQ3298076.1 hypothetical protein [Myxococcota bacterium]